MKIKLKMFASVKDIIGFEEKELIISKGITVNNIIEQLCKDNTPFLEIKDQLLFAINQNYCDLNTELFSDDILAIFPAVSGG
jgi:molybdopterin converting factor small subunit